jgi:hypothetical protein
VPESKSLAEHAVDKQYTEEGIEIEYFLAALVALWTAKMSLPSTRIVSMP